MAANQVQVQNSQQQHAIGTCSNNQFVSTCLYVGDLKPSVTARQIYCLFMQIAPVISVRIWTDAITNTSLGYAYVNYSTAEQAGRALRQLNFTPVDGKPIRIMYSDSNPSMRKSGSGNNIFINNLDKTVDAEELHDIFYVFGPIYSSKIPTDASGQSKGYGYVQFFEEEAAQNAIKKMNGMLIRGKHVSVCPFMEKKEREQAIENGKLKNVFVKNLSESLTGEDLRNYFGDYGTITNAVVVRNAEGKSKCYGFVNFENADDAAKCIESLNGKIIDGKELYVGKAYNKSESANIYIGNLDKRVDDKELCSIFSVFGTIYSAKITTDASGQSKGYGFLQFQNDEEAQNAIGEMNGRLVYGKQVFVGPYIKKQERGQANENGKFTNVFVKNLSESLTEEDLINYFGEYGTITSAVVVRDAEGKSKCFGFVNFQIADDAANSVEGLNGRKVDGKEWYVNKAHNKSESSGLCETNLYMKNLDYNIDEEKLREIFSGYGTVTSCKVMRDSNGHSKGSGFVAFASPDETSRALAEMNGRMIFSRPLYVALAQRKEERR